MAVIRSDQATGIITVDGTPVGNAYEDSSLLQLTEEQLIALRDLILIQADQLDDEQGSFSQTFLPVATTDPIQPSQVIADPVFTLPSEPIPVVPEPEINTGENMAEEAGDDLRDVTFQGAVSPAGPAIGLALLLARLGPVIAAAIRTFFGRFAQGGLVRWAALPAWVRTALVTVGAVVGTDILMDVPGIPGDGSILPFGGGDQGFHQTPHLVDGHLGAHVVGTWTANGVKFYRLSDGKLAVQNKHGRWKVWRPKKPIVIFSDGAGSLKTMLRADAALNRQSKKLAAMLNRRAPRKRTAAPKEPPVVVNVEKITH